MTYLIRFSFDPGSGVCLWAKNEAAREKFGYPIEHWELPLREYKALVAALGCMV